MGDKKQIVVADLTYIRVNQRWNYLCVLVNLSDRQIVGYHIGKHKTAKLVMSALSQIKQPTIIEIEFISFRPRVRV
ncbi:hypothetical protein [Gilliamella sp. ESL0254]|uniref:hypothetical protein n=1 Tax=Gilliamella sp. ESL0254 TaxID=2705035 RepID=UPI0015807A94|nr:hypothetical protein [Gilliamella sp. ESL0254]NUF27075.1 hypothetical protein [Gilliamella sp. ESL0254]